MRAEDRKTETQNFEAGGVHQVERSPRVVVGVHPKQQHVEEEGDWHGNRRRQQSDQAANWAVAQGEDVDLQELPANLADYGATKEML